MKRDRYVLETLSALGLVTLVLGLFVAPERIWPAWLVAVVMLLGFGLSGPLLEAILRLCAARWADGLAPVYTGLARVLPIAASAGFLVVFGTSMLYPWARPDFVEAHPIVQQKGAWLSAPFFLVRAAVVFAGFFLLVRRMQKHRDARSAAAFVIGFAVLFSIFSFDWIMSLEPEWYSTMFAVYGFCGLILSGLAVAAVVAGTGVAQGAFPDLTPDRLHDIGRMLFAFSFFWGYIWFCQYMLIWYTNIPEEAAWFTKRLHGDWATLSLLGLAVNFLIPFLVLLPAPAKRNPTVLLRIGILLLVGRWLDVFVMVTPSLFPDGPHFGPWEIGPPLAAVSAALLVVRRRTSGPQATMQKRPEMISR